MHEARVVMPAGMALRQATVAGTSQFLGAGIVAARLQRAGARADASVAREQAAQGGLASRFPTEKCFVSVTDRRMLVHSFGAMTGSPKNLLAEFAISDVVGIETATGKLTGKLTLWMADGTAVPLDVFKGGGDPADFSTAFEAVRSRLD